MSGLRPLALSALFVTSLSAHANLSVECLLRGSCIDRDRVLGHLQTLETIAKANEGNRAAGTSGHELSANYVAQQLLAAGYEVELRPFLFSKFTEVSAAFAQSAPTSAEFKKGEHFNVLRYSGSANLNGSIQEVDLALGAGNMSTSGCEAEDFAGFQAGSIALVQRGTCTFQQKLENAQAAGAAGVIFFNQGDSPDREALFSSTLTEGSDIRIPAISVPYPLGVGLRSGAVALNIQTKTESKTTYNVIADTKFGNPDNIIVVGAHLDSVPEGPGVNDNGSGSAGILEIALKMKQQNSVNKIRFAWFSAEELGLIGSTRYVDSLSQAEKGKIALMLNVDMIGSPNHKIAVYDGDGSKFGLQGPKGSDLIERRFHDFFGSTNIQSVETEMNGRSDYAAFAAAGIAVGGLFTGAEGLKTEEEAQLFGGTAGVAYDECYHKACDGMRNINIEALQQNTNAVAFVTLGFAESTAGVRANNKSAAPMARRPVVYPKHLHCHDDIYDI